MAGPNDEEQRRIEQARARAEQHSRDFDAQVSGLFNVLWSLPSAIYERGNEHGRQIGRMIDERQQRRHEEVESRGERQEEQEREDARGGKACGWRGRYREHHGHPKWRRRGEEPVVKEEVHDDQEDWVEKVTREVQKNQQEAERVYKEFDRKVLKDDEDKVWAEVFPAWSAAPSRDMKKTETALVKAGDKEMRHGPIVATAQQVEDALQQAHAEMQSLFNGGHAIAKAMQEGYNREARMWDDEGLFGSHMPFSRPLSTMFSMGLHAFMPQDSALRYMLYSEYSPLRLEHEQGFDASFRRRFEDLIRVQSGKEMREHSDQDSRMEWMARMSGLLEEQEMKRQQAEINPLMKAMGLDPVTEEVVRDVMSEISEVGAEAATEEQLYREIEQVGRQSPWPQDAPSAATRAEVLSMMTTTEQHVATDGTITTKTVLKKRFADGREETESSTTTEEPRPDPFAMRHRQFERAARLRELQEESKIVKEAKKSGGWFWSS